MERAKRRGGGGGREEDKSVSPRFVRGLYYKSRWVCAPSQAFANKSGARDARGDVDEDRAAKNEEEQCEHRRLISSVRVA